MPRRRMARRPSNGPCIATIWKWPDVLIAAGADIKLANREGATPLYLASLHGSAPMLEKLLKAGADPNTLGPEGETPLMLAARTGNLDAMRVLLDHHADVNAKDKLRWTTALMWATEQSHPEAVKLLVEHGAAVGAQTEIDTRNARNNLANTVKQRLHSSFGVLGKRGPGNDGTPPPPDGADAPKPRHPSTKAAPNGQRAVASKTSPASEANAEDDFAAFFRRPAKKDGGGLTPLVYAARENCMECAKSLVEAGADVNQRTFYGWTPLLVATQNRHYQAGRVFARTWRESEHAEQRRMDAACIWPPTIATSKAAIIRCGRRTWITWISSSC